MFSRSLSKKFSVVVALVATTFLLAACDSNLGEKPPEVVTQEFSGAQCLSSTSPVMKKFIEGDAKEADINAFWDCVGGAVTSFQRYVRGSSADSYTSQEIATFLELNFLDQSGKKNTISPALQLEFMKVKMLFLGGSRNYITQKELNNAQSVLQLLKDITLTLNPYMKVIVLKWAVSDTNQVQKDMVFFEDANTALQKAARSLAGHIEKNGQTYNLSDFVTFLKELSKTLDEDWAATKTIETYMPVVKKVKKALAGGRESEIAPNEWRRFALLGARGYVQYLRYYYFIQSVPETGSGYRLAYLSRTMEDLLSVFQDLVAEKPEGVVSRDEVTDLLNTLAKVWPEFKMSAGLVTEGMKVKQLFFGGSIDSFTTNDFQTARLKVSRLKALVERFLPYYSIYGMEWDPQMYASEEAQKFFMDSQFILESTGKELGTLFEGAYDLKDLITFAREFEALYPPQDKDKSIVAMLERFMPLVVDTKNVVIGGTDSTLAKGSWGTLLGLSSRVYTDFLYYHYFLAKQKFDTPENLTNLSVFSNQSLNILRDVLVAKAGTQLKLSEISLITRRLIEAKLLPAEIKIESIEKLFKLVLNNIMVSPQDRINGYVPNAMTMHSVERIRKELQIWIDTELFFAQTSNKWKAKEGLRPRDLAALIDKKMKDQNSSANLKEGLKELSYVVATPSPLTVDDKGRLYISRRMQQVYDQESLAQLNLNRAIARLLVRSFAGDLNRVNSYAGVSEAEVNAVFNEVRPFFIELKFLEPDNKTFGEARFRDANIFMAHSDGSDLASFTELTDLIGMIWSGMKIDKMLTEDLHKACLANLPKVNSRTEVSVDCAVKAYRQSLINNMTATPELIKYMKSADADQGNDFIYNIFKSSGYVPNKKRIAKIADLAQVPHALQYVEMLFTRFDEDNDGYLTKNEALKAFPLFAGLLKKYAGDQVEEKDMPSVFMFLLRYGKAPTTIREKLAFVLKWRGKPDNWQVAADRGKLGSILGYIADMSNQAATASVPEIPQEELDK